MPQSMDSYLIDVILKHNHFEFNGLTYRQKQGVAMSTKCAPTFANLFMASLEEEFLDFIAEKGTPMSCLWIRYIDDIFLIWPSPQETFLEFFNLLNSHHPNISYTYKLSNSSISFLDLTIHKGQRFSQTNILDIAPPPPHFKPTNRFQYLHFNSCHPPHTFKGLILGEAIRMLRASSDPLTFATALETIKKALIARKYPSKLICNTFKKVTFNSRQLLTHNQPKKNLPGPGCADLRIPYYPAKPPERVQASLPNVTQDQPITSVLTYKGNKHLSNKLVYSLIKGAPSTKIISLSTTNNILNHHLNTQPPL